MHSVNKFECFYASVVCTVLAAVFGVLRLGLAAKVTFTLAVAFVVVDLLGLIFPKRE